MTEVFTEIAGGSGSGLVLIADHASSRVPEDIDLGIDPAAMEKHIAVDIGIDMLTPLVAGKLGCPALAANVSRLVIDLHREADNPAVIPVTSDGYEVPANAALNEAGRAERIDRFWKPYHARAAELIDAHAPKMLFTLHSFTPSLESAPAERPWQVGILYNQDARGPRIAIPKLEALGIVVGDNEPYSGKLLNATMNFHAEARGLPYLAIEVRNDLIDTPEGAREWAELLAPVIAAVRDAL
jgi:predicted N-formylglutamate amidohydrolase